MAFGEIPPTNRECRIMRPLGQRSRACFCSGCGRCCVAEGMSRSDNRRIPRLCPVGALRLLGGRLPTGLGGHHRRAERLKMVAQLKGLVVVSFREVAGVDRHRWLPRSCRTADRILSATWPQLRARAMEVMRKSPGRRPDPRCSSGRDQSRGVRVARVRRESNG